MCGTNNTMSRSSNGSGVSKPTILGIQKSLYTTVDANITSVISEDGQFIHAYNISEDAFERLTFVTNSPIYGGPPMNFVSIKVYLGDNKEPTEIFGLADFINHRIIKSDVDAFIVGKNTHQPFINGWQGGLSVGNLIDNLSSFSEQIPDTLGIVKHFTLVMDPYSCSAADQAAGYWNHAGCCINGNPADRKC